MSGYDLKKTVFKRDQITEADWDDLLDEAQMMADDGEGPDDVLQGVFGLEPDYLMDLLHYVDF